MFRVVASLITIPFLLVVFLAAAITLREGQLGSVTTEIFELGPFPIAILAALVMIVVFLPMLFLASQFARLSLLTAVVVGFFSALLPVIFGTWSFLTDTQLRWGFRVERLIESYPWLIMGAIGGLLFWLFAVARNRSFDQLTKKRS